MYPPGEDKKVSVTALICTLNEAENLPHVLPLIPEWVDEILIVDGHSDDGTAETAHNVCPRAKVIYQPGKGKGDALKAGINQAQCDVIVTLDADEATNPADMPRFIQPLLDGYDMVKGSRFRGVFPRHKPWHRVLGNWLTTLTYDICFLKSYTDLCSGYNAFWKDKLAHLKWSCDGYENEPMLHSRIARKGLKVLEIGHLDRGRFKGKVKESSWRQGFKAIKSILRERFSLEAK